MSIQTHIAQAAFKQHFNADPTHIARAPGRVNLIGEHTDYNHGFVLPMAIERDTVLVAAPRTDAQIRVYAEHFDAAATIDLTHPARTPDTPWLDYLTGVVVMLQKLGHPVQGADVVVLGDVPIGAGLSSSASLEMATLALFESLGNFSLATPDASQLGLRVENEFLGLSSGIMDPFISRAGKADHALFLDCRSLEGQHIPAVLPEAQFVIAHTGVTRGLTASKYNERVTECAQAIAQLNAALHTAYTHLRDINEAALHQAHPAMGETEHRRARHVITENARTHAACDALRTADGKALGTLMNASHQSLAEDYAVSCAELDTMTHIARSLEGCYGSRMTGAGFGGCTVSLVARDQVEDFAQHLQKTYDKATGLTSEIILSSPAQGATASPL